MQPNQADYQRFIEEVIQKLMVVLGPDITFAIIKKHSGFFVNRTGKITGMSGDIAENAHSLLFSYLDLSKVAVLRSIEPILQKYPAIAEKFNKDIQALA